MAEPLFAAIATDTGWFRFNSVTRAHLCRRRATGSLRRETCGNLRRPLRTEHARPAAPARPHLDCGENGLDGRLIYSTATPQDLAETGAEATDTEDVVNRLLGVTGVEVALLFLELGPKETKVSLRSRTGFDVRKVAEQFGGGGHRPLRASAIPDRSHQRSKRVTAAVRKVL